VNFTPLLVPAPAAPPDSARPAILVCGWNL
jgi:hypothetical protein